MNSCVCSRSRKTWMDAINFSRSGCLWEEWQGSKMWWGSVECVASSAREKVLRKFDKILTCVKSGWWISWCYLCYSLKYVIMKRFPFGILFELYSANLSRRSYNYIGYKKQPWLFFCLIFTRLLSSQTYIKAHINVHCLAPTFSIHLQKCFFFKSVTYKKINRK